MKYIKTYEVMTELPFTGSSLEADIEELKSLLNKPEIIKVLKVRTDEYEQDFAITSIFGSIYEILQSDYPNLPGLSIENFPVDNCSEQGYSSGFMASIKDVAKLLNDIDSAGSIEAYLASKKYNL